jgi:hypothetical protein
VTFDPIGDFATRGYLRNFEKEKDLAIVKRAENASFTTGPDEAFASLATAETLFRPAPIGTVTPVGNQYFSPCFLLDRSSRSRSCRSETSAASCCEQKDAAPVDKNLSFRLTGPVKWGVFVTVSFSAQNPPAAMRGGFLHFGTDDDGHGGFATPAPTPQPRGSP